MNYETAEERAAFLRENALPVVEPRVANNDAVRWNIMRFDLQREQGKREFNFSSPMTVFVRAPNGICILTRDGRWIGTLFHEDKLAITTAPPTVAPPPIPLDRL